MEPLPSFTKIGSQLWSNLVNRQTNERTKFTTLPSLTDVINISKSACSEVSGRCLWARQILYLNSAARSSYAVMVDDDTFLQCWTSVDAVTSNTTSADNARHKTCFTAGVTKLRGSQQVWIKDLYGNHISDDTNSSFFGVVRMSLGSTQQLRGDGRRRHIPTVLE